MVSALISHFSLQNNDSAECHPGFPQEKGEFRNPRSRSDRDDNFTGESLKLQVHIANDFY